MMDIIFVGLGGAIGAICRYAIGLLPYKGTFPLLTLIINLIGAVIIGFIAGLSSKKSVSEYTVLFFKTGLCGGFTTFSTFSLESYQLFKNGAGLFAVIYIALSVLLCITGTYLGMYISKKI